MKGQTLKELYPDMLMMREEGMSNGEIAEALDCCIDSVTRSIGANHRKRTTPVGYYNGRYKKAEPVEEPKELRIELETPPKSSDELFFAREHIKTLEGLLNLKKAELESADKARIKAENKLELLLEMYNDLLNRLTEQE